MTGRSTRHSGITVVIADDHGVLREGLAQLIDEQTGLHVVATAADGREAIARCAELSPSVVLLDLSMPACDGFEAIGVIVRECPSTRVLVLSMHDDAETSTACMKAGAAGYVAKRFSADAIIDAIRQIAGGRSVVRVSGEAKGRLAGGRCGRHNPPDVLSPREREVLELLAYGHTSKEIGSILVVSPKSIDSYRERIYDKLGMSGRAELVRYALDHRILTVNGKPVGH